MTSSMDSLVKELADPKWTIDYDGADWEDVARRAAVHIATLEARVKELEGATSVAVTVGGGLSVFGTVEAVQRVQNYIMLDSHHPVEREDVRRSLARALQKAEAELTRLTAALSEARGANGRPVQ